MAKKNSFLARFGSIVIIIIVLALLGGLALINYRAAVLLVVGIGLAIGIRAYVGFVRDRPKKRRTTWIIGSVAVVLVAVVAGVLTLMLGRVEFAPPPSGTEILNTPVPTSPLRDEPPEPPAVVEVTQYRMVITPLQTEEQYTTFQVQETVIFDVYQGDTLVIQAAEDQLEPRQIQAERQGFQMWRLDVAPVEGDAGQIIELTDEVGGTGTFNARICVGFDCPTSTVQIEVPRDGFYAVRGLDEEEVTIEEFGQSEIVTFTPDTIRDPVVTAYVRPPFTAARGILNPFIGAVTFNEWAAAGIGLVGTVVIMPIVKPFLEEWLEGFVLDTLKSIFGSQDQNKR